MSNLTKIDITKNLIRLLRKLKKNPHTSAKNPDNSYKSANY